MVSGSRLRQIGWVAALLACLGVFFALSFSVHAVKSEVLLAEREIIALERETMMLETEFQARASQRQLADWNAVEFGYEAPRADQYLESERQLASLGSPLGPGAPSPIRVARTELAAESSEPPAMVSPLTGKPVELAVAREAEESGDFAAAFAGLIAEACTQRAGAHGPFGRGA